MRYGCRKPSSLNDLLRGHVIKKSTSESSLYVIVAYIHNNDIRKCNNLNIEEFYITKKQVEITDLIKEKLGDTTGSRNKP